MIAQELKQFTGRNRAIVRHRIQNVLFEEQMKTFDEPTPSKVARSLPSTAAAAITADKHVRKSDLSAQ